MAHRIDDHWVWLGASIALVAIAHGVRYAIQDTIRLTEVEPIRPSGNDEQEQQPEDSISFATLRTLFHSHNPNISSSAISLLLSRIHRTHGSVRALMDFDEHRSPDPETRRKARLARAFLRDWDAGDDDFTERPTWDSNILAPPPGSDAHLTAMAGWDAVPRPREAGASNLEEGEARRQRREAMVLHEGGGRVVEGDIFRPRRE